MYYICGAVPVVPLGVVQSLANDINDLNT